MAEEGGRLVGLVHGVLRSTVGEISALYGAQDARLGAGTTEEDGHELATTVCAWVSRAADFSP